jgi:hypothetical protein
VGWGPRGDSGPARGRVRASQPAKTSRSAIDNPHKFETRLLPRPVARSVHPYRMDAWQVLKNKGLWRERVPGCGRNHRRVRHIADRWVCVLAACLLAASQSPRNADGRAPSGLRVSLDASTAEAFHRYVVVAETRNNKSLAGENFLWIDDLPEKARHNAYADLKHGEIEMRRARPETSEANADIPGGMIHDWKGIVFIPGAKLDQVLDVLQDYNRHAVIYAPDVEKSKIELRDGNHYRVFLRFRRTKVVTVVLDTEHEVTYFRDSPTRAHSRSSAIRIAEVEDPGSPREKEKEPGEDQGFLWRMETWWRLEEKDGGVYVQNQVVSLTRDIPMGLGWLIEPFVTSIPKESLQFTLGATRQAVLHPK